MCLLPVLLLPVSSRGATPFENDYFTFDNPLGELVSQENFVPEGMRCRAMSIVDRTMKTPLNPQEPVNVILAGWQARVAVYVFDGNVSVSGQEIGRAYAEQAFSSLAAGSDKIDAKTRQTCVLMPQFGSSGDLITVSDIEKVTFMGHADALHSTYTFDGSRSGMLQALDVPMEIRLNIYSYYDAGADATVVAIFHQLGVDRDAARKASPDVQMQSLFFKLFQGLAGHSNRNELSTWLKSSRWQTLVPAFEQYFHLKPRGKRPPGTVTVKRRQGGVVIVIGINEWTVLINEENIEKKIIIEVIQPPADDNSSQGRRVEFEGTGYPAGVAENDTAVYLNLPVRRAVMSVNKIDGGIYILPYKDPKTTVSDVECLPDGRLTAWVNGRGWVDYVRDRTLWEPEDRKATFGLVCNNPKNGMVIWNADWVIDVDAQGEERYAYECGEPAEKVAVDRRGVIWMASSSTLRNARDGVVSNPATELEMRSYHTLLAIGEAEVMGCASSVFERAAEGMKKAEELTFPDYGANMTCAALDSRGDTWALDYGKGLLHYTGIPDKDNEPVTAVPDLRFDSRRGDTHITWFYIDRSDCFWMMQNKSLYLWRPGGLTGYGPLRGIVTSR